MKWFQKITLISLAMVFCAGLNTSAAIAGKKVNTPSKMTFQYEGTSCECWWNDPENHASCTGDATGIDEVRILAHQKNAIQHVWFDGFVKKGKEFKIDSMNANKIKFLGSTITFKIYDLTGTLLQEIEVPSPEYELLQKDDVFGSLTFKKIHYEFDIPKGYTDFVPFILMFEEFVQWEDIEAYAEQWASYGATVAMELPFINA